MGNTAQFVEFGPFLSQGRVISSIELWHYLAGTTSTLKDVYTDRAKTVTAAQPVLSDSNGVITCYGDGLYKLVIKDSDGNTLYTWDNANISDAMQRVEGTLIWDPGNLVDGAGETSPGVTVTGAAFGDYVLVAAPYDLQGITCTAYISATDTVKIRLQNKTGGAINLASGTWGVLVVKA